VPGVAAPRPSRAKPSAGHSISVPEGASRFQGVPTPLCLILVTSSDYSARLASCEIERPSAAAIPSTVDQDGLPSPRSISESMFLLTPASAARASRLTPFLVRRSRIAAPKAFCDCGFWRGRGVTIDLETVATLDLKHKRPPAVR